MSDRLMPTALHYIDHVARCGSIQSAAKELNVAASAIDRQILLLEARLGVALFERMSRGMRPTVAGDLVVTLARRWRGEERRLRAEIRHLEGVNIGHVRVVAMDSQANGLLPGFVRKLREDHPRITVEIEILNTDDALAALLNGDADVGLIFNLPPHREIRTIWSAELPLGCIVARDHPFARESAITLQKATSEPIVLQGRSLMIRRFLEAKHPWLFQQGNPPIATNSLQLVKQLVQQGSHVALTSELDAAPEIASGELVFVPVRDKAAEAQSISVATSARLPLPRIGQIVAQGLASEAEAALRGAQARVRRQASTTQ